MKKILTVILLWTALCGTAFAQNESDFKTDGRGTITKYEGWDTNIVIPAQIGGVSITAVGKNSFKNMGLTGVTLPASIRRIGDEAFASNKIVTVTIPANVTIGTGAFSSNQLTGLTIGNGCTIAKNSFSRNALKNLALGANILFEPETFDFFVYYEYMCNGRKAGTYDPAVKYTSKKDGDYEFIETKYGVVIINYTGNEINRLQIPRQLGGAVVKGINGKGTGYNYGGAFQNKNIRRMQLPDSLLFIGKDVFYDNQLTSVTIPDSVISIGNNAFWRNQLTSVTIPDSVTSIGNEAFINNELTSVTIGNSVTFIGERAFCDNKLTSVIIGNSVTTIGNGAFMRNQLTSVTIPDSVTYISGSAFNSNELTSVTFQGTITADNLGSNDDLFGFKSPFDGDLRAKYLAGGPGTYTRPNGNSNTWTKR